MADLFFKSLDGETGGSVRVGPDDLQRLLMRVGEFTTKAGGSAANTARGLAHGFDVRTALLGAVGQDEWGKLFVWPMKRSAWTPLCSRSRAKSRTRAGASAWSIRPVSAR